MGPSSPHALRQSQRHFPHFVRCCRHPSSGDVNGVKKKALMGYGYFNKSIYKIGERKISTDLRFDLSVLLVVVVLLVLRVMRVVVRRVLLLRRSGRRLRRWVVFVLRRRMRRLLRLVGALRGRRRGLAQWRKPIGVLVQRALHLLRGRRPRLWRSILLLHRRAVLLLGKKKLFHILLSTRSVLLRGPIDL